MFNLEKDSLYLDATTITLNINLYDLMEGMCRLVFYGHLT